MQCSLDSSIGVSADGDPRNEGVWSRRTATVATIPLRSSGKGVLWRLEIRDTVSSSTMTKKPANLSCPAGLLILLFMVSGCCSKRPGEAERSQDQERVAVQRRLQEVFEAAEARDFKRLDSYHLYGPEFTKFTSSFPERLDSEAGKRGEHDGLGAVNGLKMHAESLKVDLFGSTAISTFILDYTFDSSGNAVHKRDRATLVFVKRSGEWKIAHEHLSSITSP